METENAVQALSALAQASRLEAFRLLVKAGPDGLPAGDIARTLGVAPNTLSSHLALLSHAALVRSRRDGRSIIYTADFDRMTALLTFLMEDCCQGRSEVCAPLAAVAERAAYCA